MKHSLVHLLGCLLPLPVIFLLPLLGVGEGIGLFLAIVLMCACHLFMMGPHRHESDEYYLQSGGRAHEQR